MSTVDKYRTLRDALVTAPDYMAIPPREREACTRFCTVVTQLGTDRAPPALEVRVAYEAAVTEANKLVAAGRLTVDLNGAAEVAASDTERPPPPEEPEPSVAVEGPPTSPGNTDDTPPPRGDDPPEDPLALFHALVARGAKYEEYPIHPVADLFPLMEGVERRQFDDGLEVDGLLDDIVVDEDQLIDGRNRLRGCLERGVPPRFVQRKPKDGETVVNYIVKKNLHRRQLSDQQRAMLASQLAEVLTAEGKGRRAENVRKTSEILDGANLPHREEGRSAEKAAEMVNVSATAVKKAARLRRTGDETLVAAVTAGEVSLDAAVQVAELPQEEQREAVKKGKVKETAKRIRRTKAASESAPKPKAKVKRKAAAPEPAESVDEQADTQDTPEPDQSAADDYPLLAEVHEAINEMVAEARLAGRLEEVTPTLEIVARGCRHRAQRLRAGLPLK